MLIVRCMVVADGDGSGGSVASDARGVSQTEHAAAPARFSSQPHMPHVQHSDAEAAAVADAEPVDDDDDEAVADAEADDAAEEEDEEEDDDDDDDDDDDTDDETVAAAGSASTRPSRPSAV